MGAHKHSSLIAVIGPGLLVAATGVGAGDLATASFAGSLLGASIAWAVVLGAFLKFVVTEGLARWQLATGETLLEGAVHRLSPIIGWLFLPYLLLWSFFVGSALMSACGVTLYAMVPIFEDAADGKVVFGMAASVAGLVLVLNGGYRLFEGVMRVCIGIMFITAIVTAALVWPGLTDVEQSLLVPRMPVFQGQGLAWTVALLGGVGGTLTVLCYGYWIREEGRLGAEYLRTCRIDLGVGYLVTAIFGVAMVIIGSTVTIEGKGATLLVTLSDRLAETLGPVGRWMFLIGAAGAVFSSLLGVWQAVPYLFADWWALMRRRAGMQGVSSAGRNHRYVIAALSRLPRRPGRAADAGTVLELSRYPKALRHHRRDIHSAARAGAALPKRPPGMGGRGLQESAAHRHRFGGSARVLRLDRGPNRHWVAGLNRNERQGTRPGLLLRTAGGVLLGHP